MLVTQTTVLALRALTHLALTQPSAPVTPHRLAAALGASSSYLGKTLRLLVKRGILISQRGAHGGVVLARNPASISLLEVVEACQGQFIENGCGGPGDGPMCAFHGAMHEIYESTVRILSRWTLGDLVQNPEAADRFTGEVPCSMSGVVP